MRLVLSVLEAEWMTLNWVNSQVLGPPGVGWEEGLRRKIPASETKWGLGN